MAHKDMTDAEIEVSGLFEADTDRETPAGVYEIGYHLLPTLTEEDVTAAVKEISAVVSKEGATFIGDAAPVKIDLAYPIQKRVNGRLTTFDTAHFGWMAFEVQPAALATIKSFLDTNTAILRYIVTSTTKDEVTAVMQGAVIMPTAPAATGAIAAPKRAAEEGGSVSEEALSQALETMATEDAA